MNRSDKKAFTIVELLMVIGIIGILSGIVTTAASGAIRNSRSRRATALCKVVELGLNAYHAKKYSWPGSLPAQGSRQNYELNDKYNDPDKCVLTGEETRNWILKLVRETRDGTPLIDVSGLFVSRNQGEYRSKDYGLDFMSAIHGTRKSSKKMKSDDMYFGYPDRDTGHFRHFKIVYSYPTDSITVSTLDWKGAKALGEVQ